MLIGVGIFGLWNMGHGRRCPRNVHSRHCVALKKGDSHLARFHVIWLCGIWRSQSPFFKSIVVRLASRRSVKATLTGLGQRPVDHFRRGSGVAGEEGGCLGGDLLDWK